MLAGPNGAGKTNLIEAISFLVPGRGLRRATFEEVAFAEGDGSWAVSAEVEGMLGLATLGTGIEPPAAESSTRSRLCRIDREPVGSPAAFADHLRVVWLTPAMDQLFMGPASERRRFLDRLVLAVDAEHQGRVNALERAPALAQPPAGGSAARSALARRHRARDRGACGRGGGAARRDGASPARRAGAAARTTAFPSAEIALDGWMERLLPEHPAVEIEERYRGVLQGQPRPRRRRRPHARRPASHRSRRDLFAEEHSRRRRLDRRAEGAADRACAGACRPRCRDDRFAPVLLLDEVVAHLDPGRRAALFAALDRLGAQVFMTGADPAAFAGVASHADVFTVSPGQARRNA